MRDSVSNWIDLLVLAALMSVVGGILVPVFPWSSLLFAGLTAATAFSMTRRTTERSTTQVIWDVRAEAVVGAVAPRVRSPRIERF